MDNMIKVQVSELTGLALDWAVDAAVTDKPLDVVQHKSGSGEWAFFSDGVPFTQGPLPRSTDWRYGGPYMDRFVMQFTTPPEGGLTAWPYGRTSAAMHGPTHLIAGCRAIVVSKFGSVIRVPVELVQQEQPHE